MNATPTEIQQNGSSGVRPFTNGASAGIESTSSYESYAADTVGPICELMKEYCGKVKSIIESLQASIQLIDTKTIQSLSIFACAWQLDCAEEIQAPLRTIMSRASALQEHAPTGTLVSEELALRFLELRTHWHHLMNSVALLRKRLENWDSMNYVQQIRFGGGLTGSPAMGDIRHSRMGHVHEFDLNSWKKGATSNFELVIPFSTHGVLAPTTTVQQRNANGWDNVSLGVQTTHENAVILSASSKFVGRCIVR
jgi:hypothetical protein